MVNYANRQKCYAFDPATMGWVPFASMPDSRTLMEAVSVGDEGDFIVLGGERIANCQYQLVPNHFTFRNRLHKHFNDDPLQRRQQHFWRP